MYIRLTADMAVAAQISPADCAVAAAQGFAVMICNRPDDEDAGQPSAAVMRVAAVAAGLRYVHIPVDAAGIGEAQISAMADELAAAELGGSRVLAYCRSGTRSTNLWALAAATRGGDAEAIAAAAARGGFNVSGMLPVLRGLAAKA